MSPCSVGEDWVFLALLGIIVAVISFCMDYTILLCNQVRGAIFSGSWYFFPVASIIWQIFFAVEPGPRTLGLHENCENCAIGMIKHISYKHTVL